MYYKKIVGNRLYLSPIDASNYKLYTEYLNDMEVSIGLGLAHKIINEEMEKSLLEQLSQASDAHNFAIVAKKSDTVIGNISLMNLDLINSTSELGIFIGDKNYWNNGYGYEAIKLILDYGFNILNLHNIRLGVFGFNKPAISCYEKLGFEEAGRIREARKICGKRYDLIYMDILSSEYESNYISELLENKL